MGYRCHGIFRVQLELTRLGKSTRRDARELLRELTETTSTRFCHNMSSGLACPMACPAPATSQERKRTLASLCQIC